MRIQVERLLLATVALTGSAHALTTLEFKEDTESGGRVLRVSARGY